MVVICHHCTKEFPSPSKLKIHIAANHECKWCHSEFENKSELKKHLYVCESYALFKYRCENCGKTDTHKGHHEVHVLNCTMKRPQSFKCSTCDKEFSSIRAKNVHEKRHLKEKQLPCSVCEKIFHTDKDLRDHIKTHKKATCNHCNEEFIEKYLSSHIEKEHLLSNAGVSMYVAKKKKDTLYKCHLCTKEFKQFRNYENHIEKLHKTTTSTKDMPTVDCDQCSFKFLNNLSLEAHM